MWGPAWPSSCPALCLGLISVILWNRSAPFLISRLLYHSALFSSQYKVKEELSWGLWVWGDISGSLAFFLSQSQHFDWSSVKDALVVTVACDFQAAHLFMNTTFLWSACLGSPTTRQWKDDLLFKSRQSSHLLIVDPDSGLFRELMMTKPKPSFSLRWMTTSLVCRLWEAKPSGERRCWWGRHGYCCCRCWCRLRSHCEENCGGSTRSLDSSHSLGRAPLEHTSYTGTWLFSQSLNERASPVPWALFQTPVLLQDCLTGSYSPSLWMWCIFKRLWTWLRRPLGLVPFHPSQQMQVKPLLKSPCAVTCL